MIKLIAVGNRFMKDDGIAIKVTEQIKEQLTDLVLEIIIGETDSQNCLYLLNENDFVIILDAICNGTEPGSICVFSLKNVLSQPFGFCMQHDINIIELMKLYDKSFKGYLIGIEIADIGLGDELSPVLKEILPQICSNIVSTIKNIITEESSHA